MKATEASIVMGKELADLVKTLPGPYAAEAVLSKTLSSIKGKNDINGNLADVIDKQSIEWKTKVINSYSSKMTEEITPLLTAITKSLEVENAVEWLPAFKKLTGFEANDIKITALNLAHQIYLECLTIKCIEHIEN